MGKFIRSLYYKVNQNDRRNSNKKSEMGINNKIEKMSMIKFTCI